MSENQFDKLLDECRGAARGNKINESRSDLVDICSARCGWAVADQLEKILENPTAEGIDAANLNQNAVKMIYELVEFRKDEESVLVKNAIESWVKEGFGDPKVIESKLAEESKI